METVYVLNDKEKAMAGGMLLVLLIVGGLYWGFTTLFPSEEARLSSAKSMQSEVARELVNVEDYLSSLERTAQGPKESVNLGYAGSTLHDLKERVASCQANCKKIARDVAKLQKSQAVDMQLESAGLAKEAQAAREKLPTLAKRVADVEPKLKKLLE